MGESKRQHLKDLLESFDTAMFITRSGDKQHARPMAIAGVEGESTVWFVTAIDTPKTDEIQQDPRVSATFQTGTRFVAASGRAELVADRAKIHELWKPDWKVWFTEGKDDPSIRLIKMTLEDAEFWDNAGTKGIRYVFEAAKALLTGEKPQDVGGMHGRVKPNGGPISSQRS